MVIQAIISDLVASCELEDPLVALEQWPEDTYRRALWRATPRLSLTIPPGATHAPAGGDN
jgi:hypothetical protein